MKRIQFITLAILGLLAFNPFVVGQNSPIGWASFGNGTTGGAGGDTVIVTTRSELATATISGNPLVIMVQDTIDLNPWERMRVNSNKSLIGMGFNATIRLGGFEIYGDNVILQNLRITDSYDGDWSGETHSTDAITIYGTNVWVDHCDLSACADGLLDIRADNGVAANFITVSYTRFSNHNKVSLVGSSDNETEDRGKLKTTYHHCWFDGTIERGLHQRMPRIRFGDIHMLNNYFEDIASYCSAARFESDLVVEANYYRNSKEPHFRDDLGLGIEDPEIVAFENVYELVSGRRESFGNAFVPSTFYDYTPDTAVDVPALVMNEAGLFNAPGNTGPAAVPDTLELDGSGGLKIIDATANDLDPDGNSLRIARVIRTAVNFSQVRDNTILYVAPHNQSYIDTVWYQLVDTQGGVDTGIVVINSEVTGTKNQVRPEAELNIIPNPATANTWAIVSGKPGVLSEASFIVTDIHGQILSNVVDQSSTQYTDEEVRCRLNTDHLPAGVYTLLVRIKQGEFSELFIVTR